LPIVRQPITVSTRRFFGDDNGPNADQDERHFRPLRWLRTPQLAAVFLLAERELALHSKARLIGDAGCRIRAGGLFRREKTVR